MTQSNGAPPSEPGKGTPPSLDEVEVPATAPAGTRQAPLAPPAVQPSTTGSLDTRREWTRGIIAIVLLTILTAVVVASFIYLFSIPTRSTADLTALLTAIFAPIIGLIGTALGYYFGSTARDNQR